MSSISTTKLKKNVSEVMNSVFFEKKTVLIKRYGKLLGKIVPITDDAKVDVKKFFGVIPDFPEITKNRINSNRIINFDK